LRAARRYFGATEFLALPEDGGIGPIREIKLIFQEAAQMSSVVMAAVHAAGLADGSARK
jgi:hypothetical protein